MQKKYCLLAIVLSQCAVFLQAVGFPWIHLDDYRHIFENPLILNPSWANLWEFWKAPFFSLYIPVTYTVWFLLGYVTHDTWIYHFTNFLLHTGSACLVFLILSEFVESKVAALLGSLVFSLHPIQVEAVAWVSGLKDCLSGFLCLLAIYGYTLRLKEKRAIPTWAFLVLFVLAFLSKPAAIVLPVFFLIFRQYFLKEKWSVSFKHLAIFFFLLVPFAFLTKETQPNFEVKDLSPFWFRPVIAFHAIGFYLKQVFAPLSFYLDYGKKPTWVLTQGGRDLILLIPLFVLTGLTYYFRRNRLFLLACALTLLPVLPVLGLVPFQFQLFSTVADRYFYLSMLGIGLGVACLPPKPEMGVIVLLLGALTFHQVGYWESTEKIFNHTLNENPKSFMVHNNLAFIYFERHEYEKASKHLKAATELRPEELGLFINYTAALVRSGRTQEAITVLKHVLSRDPNHAQAQRMLSKLKG